MNDWDQNQKHSSVPLKVELIAITVARALTLVATMIFLLGPRPSDAHPGGLAADGCHNDRKNGGRHCHRSTNAVQSTERPSKGSVYYPNCAAARAANAAPVYRGQPGYGRHLDRDNDGKACE
ncbi:excalibur calcium-binding domain-containing protein [Erythrobacter sp. W302b]|uniref:excalibur calcium-binding domain-containing protein n=1 Tax=Erythrobacter sp. W302b TaxID=3389874 RepID=UPI00396B10D8